MVMEKWVEENLLNIAPLQRGFDLPKPQLVSGEYPVVYSNGIENYHKYFMAKSPGVVTGRSGTIGKVTYVEKDYWPHNTALWVTDFKGNDPKFIFYLYTYINLERFGTGSGVPTLNRNDVHNYVVSLPPTKAEQTAIAIALSDADALIQSLEKLIAKKRNIKQGAMQELLKPKEGWGEDKVKNLASITTGAKNTQDRIEDGQFPFFVRSQKIEKINSYSFDGEAVLTAGDGVGTGKIYHYINGKFDFHQRVYKISEFVDKLNGYYFYLYFSNNFFNRIMQMTAKSSVDSVRLEMIADMLIPLPSITVQTRIAAILSDMDAEIAALETKLAKYKQIKQGMMQELLTGRIRLV